MSSLCRADSLSIGAKILLDRTVYVVRAVEGNSPTEMQAIVPPEVSVYITPYDALQSGIGLPLIHGIQRKFADSLIVRFPASEKVKRLT